MRIMHLTTVAFVVGALAASAHAQESPRASTEIRARSGSPRRVRMDAELDQEHRAALGLGTSTSGTLRDTLGLLVTSITRNSPAEKAGLEEGNRLAAINGVSLRANAADVEDHDMSSALTRRLIRELGKAKPGDEVELRVYRDGRVQNMKIKTADSDSLFRRTETGWFTQSDRADRPTLGLGIGSSGSRRDTLGVLVMSVLDSSPAARAALEEGNRIAAINGVNLRVTAEDAGDRYLGEAKAQRLQREVSQLKPGENVTLKVYSQGRFRDVTMKVARAADLPRGQGMFFSGDGMNGMMPPMPPMPARPSMRAMTPMPPMEVDRVDLGPEFRRGMNELRVQLRELRPQLDEIGPRVQRELDAIRPELERIEPRIRMELENVRPQIEHLRMELPELMDRVRSLPRIRMNVIV